MIIIRLIINAMKFVIKVQNINMNITENVMLIVKKDFYMMKIIIK